MSELETEIKKLEDYITSGEIISPLMLKALEKLIQLKKNQLRKQKIQEVIDDDSDE